MKRILLVISTLALGLIPFGSSRACSRIKPFTLDELFGNAEIIVRATAVKYSKRPDSSRLKTTGVPDTTIEFRIEENLRGKNLSNELILNGYLSNEDDFNEMPVPYMFVRPTGRFGSCFANTYKEGAQFLLFVAKTEDGFTTNISALGPTNEQLHSDEDPWLVWVREHLKTLSLKEKSLPRSAAQSETVNDDWPRVQLCHFSFVLPPELKRTDIRGIDSCMAEFTSDAIRLYLDYGYYTGPKEKSIRDFDFKEQSMTIGGKTAQVVTYNDDTTYSGGKKPYFRYFANLYVVVGPAKGERSREVSLTMHVGSEKESGQEIALRIFRSIRFE